MKKIVVRIVTYNQEDVIGRALDSVLCQREWGLYRVIVSDDCSKDQTWDVLQRYQRQYPDVVYIYRNEHNYGIYGNVAQSESYLPNDYDLFGGLSGDDVYCNGYFEAVQKLILEKDIDTNGLVGFYSDWKSISPNGEEKLHRQECVQSKYTLLSLKLRGFIASRSIMMTKGVRDLYAPILINKGLALTEGDNDLQPHVIIKEAYYLPLVTSYYYTGIGVSTQLSAKNTAYYTTQHIEMWQYFMDHYIQTKRDMHYAQYELLKAKFYKKPTLGKIVLMLYHYNHGQLPTIRTPFKKKFHLFLSLVKYRFQYS